MKAYLIRFFYVLSAVFVFCVFTTSTAFAVTIEVDTPGHPSSGGGGCKTGVLNDCSFEEAIIFANATPGADDIVFNMLGLFPNWTLALSSPVTITEALSIDGYTQGWPGAPNTVPAPGLSDGVVNVMIDGSGLNPGDDCININTVVSGDPVTIKGLNVSSCPNHGINITGSNVTIQGSYIGTDFPGLGALPNGGSGIYADSACDILIGGPNPADRNVISGNLGNGIKFSETVSGSDIEGNFIGLDKTGLNALGNGDYGISMGDAKFPTSISGNNVGNGPSDSGDGKRNYISGNGAKGIFVAGGWTTKYFGWIHIDNNYIGTDVNGTSAVPNGKGGIDIAISDNVKIENNLISGNIGDGITVTGDNKLGVYSYNIRILNNYIGVDSSGTSPVGNAGTGVMLRNGANRCIVGDSSIPGSGNIIANNILAGVTVLEENPFFPTDDNKIELNSIYDSGGIGIDLAGGGVESNDALDADTGANHLQNYPIVGFASYSGGNTTINASLHSVPLRDNYRVDFYANDAADGTGYGEGQTYLGGLTGINLDAAGDATFSLVVTGDYTGKYITATTTDKSLYTSEFGPMTSADLSVTKGVTAATNQGDNVTFTITVSNAAGPNNASGVQVTDLIGGGFTYISHSASAGTYNNTTGVWDVGTLAVGGSETLSINAKLDSCGNLSNAATITRGGFDGDTTNNIATTTLTDITCPPVAGGRPDDYVSGGGQSSSFSADIEQTEETTQKYCSYNLSPVNLEEITRYEFTKLILELYCYDLPDSIPEGEKSYTDYSREVYDDLELNSVIAAMYLATDEGIIGGYPDGSLRPYEPIVYAEAAKIIFNAMDEDTLGYNHYLTLMPKYLMGSEWFAKYFIFIVELLGDGDLVPAGTISSEDAEEMVEFVMDKYPE